MDAEAAFGEQGQPAGVVVLVHAGEDVSGSRAAVAADPDPPAVMLAEPGQCRFQQCQADALALEGRVDRDDGEPAQFGFKACSVIGCPADDGSQEADRTAVLNGHEEAGIVARPVVGIGQNPRDEPPLGHGVLLQSPIPDGQYLSKVRASKRSYLLAAHTASLKDVIRIFRSPQPGSTAVSPPDGSAASPEMRVSGLGVALSTGPDERGE